MNQDYDDLDLSRRVLRLGTAADRGCVDRWPIESVDDGRNRFLDCDHL